MIPGPILAVPLILLLSSYSPGRMVESAKEPDSYRDKSNLSINPIRFIVGTAAGPTFLIFLNWEKFYKGGASFILTPVAILGSGGSVFGFSAGPRKYLNQTSSGVYLQAKGHLYAGDEFFAQAVGYVGIKGEFDTIVLFLDAGLGFSNYGLGGDANFAVGFIF